jgi:hypothetical protein
MAASNWLCGSPFTEVMAMRGGSAKVLVGLEVSLLQAAMASVARLTGPRQRVNNRAVVVVRFIGVRA